MDWQRVKHEDGIAKKLLSVKLRGKCLQASLRLRGEQKVRKYCPREGRKNMRGNSGGRLGGEEEEEIQEFRGRWKD